MNYFWQMSSPEVGHDWLTVLKCRFDWLSVFFLLFRDTCALKCLQITKPFFNCVCVTIDTLFSKVLEAPDVTISVSLGICCHEKTFAVIVH